MHDHRYPSNVIASAKLHHEVPKIIEDHVDKVYAQNQHAQKQQPSFSGWKGKNAESEIINNYLNMHYLQQKNLRPQSDAESYRRKPGWM